MSIKHGWVLALLLGVGTLLAGTPRQPLAQGQDTLTRNTPATAEQKDTAGDKPTGIILRLRTVPAHLIAWWLDPEHNSKPSEIVAPDGDGGGQFAKTHQQGTTFDRPGFFNLPEGIEALTAVDAPNALLVRGTPAAIKELEVIVGFLDRTQPRLEIEVQFVAVNTKATKAFGIDSNSSTGLFTANAAAQSPGPSSSLLPMDPMRNNSQSMLRALLSAQYAEIITVHRLTAINNLPVLASALVSVPLELNSTISGAEGKPITQHDVPRILTHISLEVTPITNNDGTITMIARRQIKRPMPIPAQGSPVPKVTTKAGSIVINVKDGDTIALGGLHTRVITRPRQQVPGLANIPRRFFGRSHDSRNQQRELIIFLTPRIIPQVEQVQKADPVPGS